MKLKHVHCIICLLIFSLFATQAWPANILNSDSNYDIIIAVTINEDDYIMGKLEYSNHAPQCQLQLVTFNPIGGVIHAEPYVFEILERKIISKNVHKIKCRSTNDKYVGHVVTGTIDFINEIKPKIHLKYENGHTFISNLSEKGKKTHKKYIPNVWLGN
jgi:hypothetical protein